MAVQAVYYILLTCRLYLVMARIKSELAKGGYITPRLFDTGIRELARCLKGAYSRQESAEESGIERRTFREDVQKSS